MKKSAHEITQQEYEALCREIWFHNKKYYVEHDPVISDEEFDFLLKRLQEIENLHPEWVTKDSPTKRVGEFVSEGFKTIVHKTPMLSLANTYSKEEVVDFLERMDKLAQRSRLAYCCELKMDGVAVSAVYEKGEFVQGVTRGDGHRGDDITANLRTIRSLPHRIKGSHIPDYLEIRGEVYMKHEVFARLNKEKEDAGEPTWANPRNAAAGSLKLLDSRIAAARGLDVVFYGLAEESSRNVNKQSDIHPYLNSLGLPTLHYIARCESLDEIWRFVEKIKDTRHSLPFDIDGVVIKLDDLQEQKRLGNTAKNPRWAIAYKFAAEQAETLMHDITVQVGRTGALTPVAELNPVFLAGSTIARATLHNEEEVMRKDFRVGDTVVIEKGGDVIPKVVSVVLGRRPAHSKPWKMPEHCPSCHAAVVRLPEEVAVRCPNPHCPAQQLRRVIFFAGKSAMDIDNMGEKVVEQLIRKGFVKRVSDIYALTEDQISQLDGFKQKSVDNLMKSIKASREVTLARFIHALGIKHVGTGIADLLASKAGTLDRLMTISETELKSIEGIGDKVAGSVSSFFADPHHRKEIERLLEFGVIPKSREVKNFADHPFFDKHFVLTGTLAHYTRQSASSLIKERGGFVSDSLSKKTNYLIVGESPGSKIEKAKTLGVKILTEEEFNAML